LIDDNDFAFVFGRSW